MFRGVVHVDPVDQVFLDPVTTEVGILLVDVRNGLIEIESLSIRPDKPALRGIEMHVLHEITERVGELGKLLAFGRMPRGAEALAGCDFPSESPIRAAPDHEHRHG